MKSAFHLGSMDSDIGLCFLHKVEGMFFMDVKDQCICSEA